MQDRGELLICTDKPKFPWIDFVAPLSVIVALFAIWANHSLAMRRQRRDERFKLCQTARDLVNESALLAADIWNKRGDEPSNAKSIATILDRMGRLGRILEMLRGRDRRFDFGNTLIEFRRAATADIEDEVRLPDADRAGDVLGRAGELEEAIDREYRQLHG